MLRPTAKSVQSLPNSRVKVRFDNNETRTFDVTPYIKGTWYGHLADAEYFSKVKANGNSIEWPDGQDICPDELYYGSIPD